MLSGAWLEVRPWTIRRTPEYEYIDTNLKPFGYFTLLLLDEFLFLHTLSLYLIQLLHEAGDESKKYCAFGFLY